MSMDGTAGGVTTQDRASIKYCVECGAKVPRGQKVCPACGETQ